MSAGAPVWIEAVAAVLLVTSGVFILVSAFGFVSLKDFFLRMHPPAVAYTLGCWSVTLAGILTFSAVEPGVAVHPWLVNVLLCITVPVTTALLARASLFRHRHAGTVDAPPPLTDRSSRERGRSDSA